MPFYEYECPKCGFKDEVLQKISEKPLKKCPSCGKAGLRKLMSAPVFRLKGSGWYETDFKSDKENKRNLAGAEKEEAKTEAKADDKKDTKAEAKVDSKADSKADGKAEKAEGKSEAKAESAKPAAEKTASTPAKSKRKGASRSKRGSRR